MLLDAGADINYQDKDGKTALIHAANKLNMGMVYDLLCVYRKEASAIESAKVALPAEMQAMLDEVARLDHIQDASLEQRLLIVDIAASVNVKDRNEHTALWYARKALQTANTAIVQLPRGSVERKEMALKIQRGENIIKMLEEAGATL